MSNPRKDPDIRALVEGVRVAASHASEAAAHVNDASQAGALLRTAIDELRAVVHAAQVPNILNEATVGRVMRGMRLVANLVASEAIPGIDPRDADAIFAAQRHARATLRAHEREYVVTSEPVAVGKGGHESSVMFRPPDSKRGTPWELVEVQVADGRWHMLWTRSRERESD